ncbi:hypothetical protein E0W68_08355 [Flavobacterium salilacus subsp. salilacus]|uniref:hypothetical protein n=1 Tax=Flavobacterium TaxID=237 RepID=UPI001074B8D5|nr:MULTISPECIES: hypothetical protein [Flavobacterium]KAF2518753.1 hypothetical protein E0W68_08355 [Flavobacterium salilacus subsp. salilacus]MBE1613720.1 hypothetical protein [Flavobacterium sp. SaA2.13]
MNEINENQYKPDFELLDKYVNYSSELMRISILLITSMGALTIFKTKCDEVIPHNSLISFYISFVILAISIGCSLFHRYLATDSMACYISYLRKVDEDKKEKEKVRFKKGLIVSHSILKINAITFGLGVIAFVLGIAVKIEQIS